ncbi:hypothetical protein [Streptomyces caniscabiei]|uniref:hypothetical protein n=1 Tax=Streptomyces caniscabiei TaxID=2746961 RepID=UPI0038D4BDDD
MKNRRLLEKALPDHTITWDPAVVSDALIAADPQAIDAWRAAQAEALRLLKSDPDGSVKAVAAELGISAADAEAQLSPRPRRRCPRRTPAPSASTVSPTGTAGAARPSPPSGRWI